MGFKKSMGRHERNSATKLNQKTFETSRNECSGRDKTVIVL